jgi:phosphate:Na+ symporter
MKNDLTVQIWSFLAGLGLFLFGMYLMEESIRMLTGRTFKIFLRRQTDTPLKAIISGAITTAILQSSTMVTLLVMSFASAGIIGLKSGIGIILGANLGTTITGWMVSFIGFKLNFETYSLPFLAIGGLGTIFLKNPKLSFLSKLLMGFAFVFIGLGYIKESFGSVAKNVDFTFLQDKPIFLFLFVGIVLTALIQSSSASVAIYLSSLAAGLINLEQAAFLVIGSDLGTTITALIGTINANQMKKKTGLAHVYFNLFQSFLAIILLPFQLFLAQHVFQIKEELFVLVFLHTSFNLTGIIIAFPFLNLFTKFLEKTSNGALKSYTTYLKNNHSIEIISSIELLKKEAFIFAEASVKVARFFLTIEKLNGSVMQEYRKIKEYENEITAYYFKVQQISKTQSEAEELETVTAIFRLLALAVKDVKDVKHNLDSMKESAEDLEFNLFQRIKKRQSKLYDLYVLKLNNLHHSKKDHSIELETMQYEIQSSYSLTAWRNQTKKENLKALDFASYMNLVTELNHSNSSLIEAYKQLANLNKNALKK